MSSPKEINSFAVFDLETTGLPSHNFNKANTTEFSVHAFSADYVRHRTAPEKRRVNHSLSVLFNPRMMISPKAEEITGLNNYMLEKESPFNENAASMIISFIKHLRQPVCLVAHNGDSFDFPLLKDAFKKLKMELPHDVLCVDTLKAIWDIDQKRKEELAARLEGEKAARLDEKKACGTEEKSSTSSEEGEDNEEDFQLNSIPFLNDNEDNSATEATPCKVQPDKPKQVISNSISDRTTIRSEEDDEKSPIDWQKINESTPKQGVKTSPKLKQKLKASVPRQHLNRRCLDFTKSTQTPSPTAPRAPSGFYKLENIYTRLLGKAPQVTHHAEADVILLKEVMFEYGESFVKWAEENAQPFSSVRPLSGF